MKRFLIFNSMLVLLLLVGCTGTDEGEKDQGLNDEEIVEIQKEDNDTTPSPIKKEHEKTNDYTEDELKSDPKAPSDDPDDYNYDGEFVPQDGPSDNPEDYNFEGEYKPVEDMTIEEIEKELEEMFGR